ncbi:serine/threonine protein kinase [Phlyctema vagabunda]|uniref:Serine/threonine protein kinase n=1 Tax=Phlyctema vagabunda TaxID=108571 RepID=A0ABR4PPM1_9HELO
MNTLPLRQLEKAQVLTALSTRKYRLTELASSANQHVWSAHSERSESPHGTSSSSCTILTEISDGTQVIIKSPLRKQHAQQSRAIRRLDTEMMILNHPLKDTEGIQQLIDQIIITPSCGTQVRAGVFEYLDHDFHTFQKCRLSQLEIKSIARQVFKALSTTHGQNIVHTDLKLENLVFTRLMNSISVNITNFGMASLDFNDRHRLITNPCWRSPESWLGMPWGPPADIWSVGAIIGSLMMEPGAMLFQPVGSPAGSQREDRDQEFIRSLCTIVPFPKTFLQRSPTEWQERISRLSPRLTPTGAPISLSSIGETFQIPRPDWEFVRDILEVDPDERPTASEILKHPWLNS